MPQDQDMPTLLSCNFTCSAISCIKFFFVSSLESLAGRHRDVFRDLRALAVFAKI